MKHHLEDLLVQLERAPLRQKYQILVKIRVEYLKETLGLKHFVYKKGVETCLRIIKNVDEKCLEVIFSILGNVCMLKEGTEAAMIEPEYFITFLSSTLLSCKNSSKFRILRLSGNLMLNTEEGFNKFEEIQHALCILLEQVNPLALVDDEIEGTTMLVRAIRIFWKSKSFSNSFIATESIKKVTNILISCFQLKNENNSINNDIKRSKFERVYTFPKSAPEVAVKHVDDLQHAEEVVVDKKQTTSLIDGIIKLLSTVTLEYKSNVIDQILYDKVTAKVIIRLISSKYGSTILKMFVQFSGHPILIEALGLFDGVTLLSHMIISEKTSKANLKNCILILSQLTSQSCNRLKIRQSGSFKKLIQTVATSLDDEEIKLVIFTLYQFRFDPLSLDCMVNYGVMKILIKQLELKIDTEYSEATPHKKEKTEKKPKGLKTIELNETKNKTPVDISYYTQKSFRSIKTVEVGSDCSKYNMGSPCSSSSGYSSEEYDTTNPSYDYSPICSDNEEDTLIPTSNDQIPPSEHVFDFTTLMVEDNVCDEDSNMSFPDGDFEKSITQYDQFKNNFLKCLLELLVELTRHQVSYQKDFCSQNTLKGLIKSLDADFSIQYQVAKILKHILSDIKYYVAMLHQSFIFDLFEKRFFPDCVRDCENCKEIASNIISIINCLSTNAISGYGIGEITHLLQKSDAKMQLHGAIMSVYLVKCRKALETVLFHHRGFDIMIQYIKNFPEEKSSVHAVNGFSMLAINLHISIEQQINSFDEMIEFNVDNWKDLQFVEETVSFLGSDGVEIQFQKSLLISMSEVFQTMFASSFKEANDQKVVLKYISGPALMYFLKLLYEESRNSASSTILVSNMLDLLQAYQLSKLYLLVALEKKLYAVILKCIDFTNVHSVVQWSLDNLDEFLFDAAITYYLSSDIIGQDKLLMYKNAINSPFCEQWIEKLKDIILYYCNE